MAAEECYKVGSCGNSVLDVGSLCRKIENKSSDTLSLEFGGKTLASSDRSINIGTQETEMKSNLQIPKRPSDLSSTRKSSDEDDDTSENIKLMAMKANKFIKQENWPKAVSLTKAERFIQDMFRIAERKGTESLPIMAAEQWNLWLGTA
ncbi:hypothetical protein H072_3417 [Dactylellina haptotyla CBS 200.50]|uniref:Uncharacterized protein n=1 Tax=Dactylellina haptotyla (strain CBS 200.50) TaxID=1284197 RepID=S8C4F5_DACHA|nr:hypothetical protein H072_3417 [Dactylellina haptotyla CBS 200.50]